MNRIFRYLDKALNDLYKYDQEIIEKQSLNSISFRLGLYLNNYLKNDHLYNYLYVDYKFYDDSNHCMDLVIHDRKNYCDLLVIKLEKDRLGLKSNLESIKVITNLDSKNYGVLVVLNNENYNVYKMSSRYYDIEL